MSETAQELAAFMLGVALIITIIGGGTVIGMRATAEKMKACAAMCRDGIAEYRNDECVCRGKP